MRNNLTRIIRVSFGSSRKALPLEMGAVMDSRTSMALVAVLVFVCMTFVAERGPGPRDVNVEEDQGSDKNREVALVKHDLREASRHENAAADAEVSCESAKTSFLFFLEKH